MNQTFTTPILFLIYNRPENTRIVFDKIKKIKPSKLYIAADGPRESILKDFDNCIKAREILNQINWDCEVKTLLRDKNLGCKVSVSSAIKWFFENEESGIILEDDCVPDQSFFWFCQELLERYKYDERIMMISGSNYLLNEKEILESYFFTNYYSIWGWAAWRRAWDLYDIKMHNWEELKKNNQLEWFYKDKRIADLISSMMQATYDNKIDTWDLQWVYTCIINNGLSIMPGINLVSNTGTTGTHSEDSNIFSNMPVKSIDVKHMLHPIFLFPDVRYNKMLFDNIIRGVTVSKYNKIKTFIKIILIRFIRIFKKDFVQLPVLHRKFKGK